MEITLENSKLSLRINKSGAELTSIKSKQTGIEYLWQADPKVWARHAPILFPIVGKLKNSKYYYNENEYTLPQHGFARDLPFEIIEANSENVRFQLKASEATLKLYPFDFLLEISYILDESTIKIFYKVKNEGEVIMPFSIGAHPGFNCPLKEGEDLEDYYIEFEHPEDLNTFNLSEGLLSGETYSLGQRNKILPLHKNLFDKDALIFKNLNSKKITLRSKVHPHYIDLSFADFPYLGIWAKPGTFSFICLEPWLGIADYIYSDGDIMKKEGIQLLGPKQIHQSSYALEVK